MLHNALRKAPSGQEISPKSLLILLILGYGIIKNNALQISTCPVPQTAHLGDKTIVVFVP